MSELILNLEFLMRIILAGLCGLGIGYERKTRGKGAGVRTHMIVALASSLMMIISKFGFADVGSDGSRVAAQIVSGIGFLGAGMIYVHRNSISGLTTAAGIWATAGIGMAVGAGMYFIGIASTVVVLASQIFLHKDLKFMQMPSEFEIEVIFPEREKSSEFIRNFFAEHGFAIDKIKMMKRDGMVETKVHVTAPPGMEINDIMRLMDEVDNIESVSIS